MSSLAATLGITPTDHPLKHAFLTWQCRVRQMSMRDNEGRPNEAIMPDVFLAAETEALGAIITVLNKSPGYSLTAELNYMSAKTNDPAQRRENAIRFLSSTYYQKHREFSDILTATFPPKSPGAAQIRSSETVRLVFAAYNQQFDLTCKVWRLVGRNPLFQATMAHNKLFNPTLAPDTEVLGFEPNWEASKADPDLTR